MQDRLGIMSAMHEEIELLIHELKETSTETHGGRIYHFGLLWGHPVLLVQSRYGKVAAAITATEMISKYEIKKLIFTGVAGALDPAVSVGDIVIGTKLLQHDMDARPLFGRHEIPLLGRSVFETDPELSEGLHQACVAYLKTNPPRVHGSNHAPREWLGMIASGDQFISESTKIQDIRERVPGVLCVEMEGAAVGQVCFEYGIPFGIVRTISDSANEEAPVDFTKFVEKIASIYSREILRELITSRFYGGVSA